MTIWCDLLISFGTDAASFTQTECGLGPMPRSSGVLLPEHLIRSRISGSFLQPGSTWQLDISACALAALSSFRLQPTALSATGLLFQSRVPLHAPEEESRAGSMESQPAASPGPSCEEQAGAVVTVGPSCAKLAVEGTWNAPLPRRIS